jgi:hypothetical protein
MSPTHNLKGIPLAGMTYDVAFHLRKEDIRNSILPQMKVRKPVKPFVLLD